MSIPEASHNEPTHVSPNSYFRRRTVVLIAVVLLAAGILRGVAEYAEAQRIHWGNGVTPTAGNVLSGSPGGSPSYGEGMLGGAPGPGPGGAPGYGGMPGNMPGAMPGSYSPPSGVQVHITLADGQSIDLRANDVVLTFPSGGSVRATESGLMPILPPTTNGPSVPTMPALPPALQWSDSPPATTPPLEPPATPGPAVYVPIQTDPPAGVNPNTGGIQPVEPTIEEQSPGSETPR